MSRTERSSEHAEMWTPKLSDEVWMNYPDFKEPKGKVIWLIMARYMVALAAGSTWASRWPLAVKLLWTAAVVALIVRDGFFDGLRRDGLCGLRSAQRARELGEDRQVGVEPNALNPSDAERE